MFTKEPTPLAQVPQWLARLIPPGYKRKGEEFALCELPQSKKARRLVDEFVVQWTHPVWETMSDIWVLLFTPYWRDEDTISDYWKYEKLISYTCTAARKAFVDIVRVMSWERDHIPAEKYLAFKQKWFDRKDKLEDTLESDERVLGRMVVPFRNKYKNPESGNVCVSCEVPAIVWVEILYLFAIDSFCYSKEMQFMSYTCKASRLGFERMILKGLQYSYYHMKHPYPIAVYHPLPFNWPCPETGKLIWDDKRQKEFFHTERYKRKYLPYVEYGVRFHARVYDPISLVKLRDPLCFLKKDQHIEQGDHRDPLVID